MQVTGIWNHLPASHLMASAQSASNQTTASGTDSSSGDSATISANDFLTLLVTEMQNQDPTADTDPNEYINQLVQVNSLEQLISINQTLTTDSTPTATGAAANTPGASQVLSGVGQVQSTGTGVTPQSATQQLAQGSIAPGLRSTEGNLMVPAASPAAQRIAESLTRGR